MTQLLDRDSPDGERIDLDNEQDLHFWMSELEVSGEELRQAVAAVGPQADLVRAYLGGRFTRA